MSILTKETLELIKKAFNERLKENFDFNVNKDLEIDKISETKKTIYFKEIKVKVDKKTNYIFYPEVYTPVGFEKFILEKDSMQIDIGMEADSENHYRNKIKEEQEENYRKDKQRQRSFFENKLKKAIQKEFKEKYDIELGEFNVKEHSISSSGKQFIAYPMVVKNEGIEFKIRPKLNMVEANANFLNMDFNMAQNVFVEPILEIKTEENLENIVKNIVSEKTNNNNNKKNKFKKK